jgi:alanyl-tRNA synthetase
MASIVGGSGGGKPHLAQAGGKLPEKLPEALACVEAIVRDALG